MTALLRVLNLANATLLGLACFYAFQMISGECTRQCAGEAPAGRYYRAVCGGEIRPFQDSTLTPFLPPHPPRPLPTTTPQAP